MKFRRRPETTIIEAEKHEPGNPRAGYATGVCPRPGQECPVPLRGGLDEGLVPGAGRVPHVHSASGIMTVLHGDWIVRERTERPLYYKIVPEEFVKLYEPADKPTEA